MEDYQKEFMSIKTSINQKDKLLLKRQDFFSVNITEDMRTKIKRFWHECSVESQVGMFLENNGRASKMVTKAMQKFGDMYIAAKKNPSNFSAIDKAITDKTYFSKEVLPGFEGRLSMTQLFCNGRNSGGAYRMHNFFYMLPTKEFESEGPETDNLQIGELMKNVDTYADFSKDAMYCLNLLKEVYGTIRLRYFKMGVFLGDYLPDNLWSAWRYMNCREFTFGPTTIIPISAYDDFIDSAEECTKLFLSKLQPCILTQLWTSNIAITVFSTLFENTLLLSFFCKNPKLAQRYGFTSACIAPKAGLGGISIGTPSSRQSRSDSGSDLAADDAQNTTVQLISLQAKASAGITKSQYATSNSSESQFSLSSGSQSLSHNSVSQTRSSRGQGLLSLKKQLKPRQTKTPMMWTGPNIPADGQKDYFSREACYIDQFQDGRYLSIMHGSTAYPLHSSGEFPNCNRVPHTPGMDLAVQQAVEKLRGQVIAIVEPRREATASHIPSKEARRYFVRNQKVQSKDQDWVKGLSPSELRLGETLLKLSAVKNTSAAPVITDPGPANIREFFVSENDEKTRTAIALQKSTLNSRTPTSYPAPAPVPGPCRLPVHPMPLELNSLRSEEEVEVLFGNLIRRGLVRLVSKRTHLPSSFTNLKLDLLGTPPRFQQFHSSKY